MAQQNSISKKIEGKDLDAIRAAVEALRTTLLPYLTTLSAAERQKLSKMGDKSVAFVTKAYEYGQKNPALVPSYLDMAELAADVGLVETLRELSQGLLPITDAIDDTMLLAGSDAMQGALTFYNNAKVAAKAKAPNAATIYEDLAERFPGTATKRATAKVS